MRDYWTNMGRGASQLWKWIRQWVNFSKFPNLSFFPQQTKKLSMRTQLCVTKILSYLYWIMFVFIFDFRPWRILPLSLFFRFESRGPPYARMPRLISTQRNFCCLIFYVSENDILQISWFIFSPIIDSNYNFGPMRKPEVSK